MAYPVWRRSKKLVYVYYNDPNSGKLIQLPRKLTKELDGKPADYVYRWVEKWEHENGRVIQRVERIHLKEGDLLLKLWRQFRDQQQADRVTPRRAGTLRGEEDYFYNYIVQFFVGRHQKKDPAIWHDLIPAFHLYLSSETQLAPSSRRQVLWIIKRFGDYLVFAQHMTFPFAIRVPKGARAKITPLKVKKTPEDILNFVKNTEYNKPEINYQLAVLLGYFAGLGPSELFALNKEDLLTGDLAETKSKTLKDFRKINLGSRLAVQVNKTLPNINDAKPVMLTKNDYRTGIVTIWNSEAAKLIAAQVRDLAPGRLFPFSYSWLMHLWRKKVYPKLQTTPHDLRRASCLYLGRTLRIPLTLLQEHMRHGYIGTTMLYAREPATMEQGLAPVLQDFDDVA